MMHPHRKLGGWWACALLSRSLFGCVKDVKVGAFKWKFSLCFETFNKVQARRSVAVARQLNSLGFSLKKLKSESFSAGQSMTGPVRVIGEEEAELKPGFGCDRKREAAATVWSV